MALGSLLLVLYTCNLVGAFSPAIRPSHRHGNTLQLISARRPLAAAAVHMEEGPATGEAASADAEEPAPAEASSDATELPGMANKVEGLDFGEYTNPMTSWNPNAPPTDMDKVKQAQAKRAAYFAQAAKGTPEGEGFEPDGGAIGFLAGAAAVALAATFVFQPQAFSG